MICKRVTDIYAINALVLIEFLIELKKFLISKESLVISFWRRQDCNVVRILLINKSINILENRIITYNNGIHPNLLSEFVITTTHR